MIRWVPAVSSRQEDSTAPVRRADRGPVGAHDLVDHGRRAGGLDDADAPALADRADARAAVDLGRLDDRAGHPGGAEGDRRTGGGVVEALGDQPRGAEALAGAGAVADEDRVGSVAGQRAGDLVAEGVRADRGAVGAKDLGHRVQAPLWWIVRIRI